MSRDGGGDTGRYVLLGMAALAAVAILYYGVIFTGQLPDHRWVRGYNDWVLHAVAFFVLSLPLLLIWRGRVVFTALTLLASVVELAQFWVPRRNPGVDDVLAGCFGILTGVLVIFLLRRAGAVKRQKD